MLNRKNVKKLIIAHGVEETLDICFEECGELVQAISKVKRTHRKDDAAEKAAAVYELANEMADVIIIMSMLQHICRIPDGELLRAIETKMDRNLKRIEDGEE